MPLQNLSPILVPPLLNGLGAHAPVIERKSASWTATAADSGKKFIVVGATAAVVCTLPAIADGPYAFEVYNASDQNLTMTAASADTAITYNDLTADGVAFSTASEKLGGSFEILCDGTSLLILARICSSYQNVTVNT